MMMKLLAELKRRQMFRVAAAYAVVAWLILQVVNNIAPGLNLPNWAITLVIVLLGAGFPVALLFCWIQQLAPAGDAPVQAKSSRLDWTIAGGLAAVIALIIYQQLAPAYERDAERQASLAPGAGSEAQTVGISIAVLPFVNLSDDRAQEFFSDGMTDEISGALARVQNLRVIARSSAFQFKGQNQDVRGVGRALGASHLVEGSVRKAGERLRITAQLVRAGDGVQLWSENYDRNLTDIFAIQEEIAQAIAGALRVPLGLTQGESLVPNRTNDLQSYQQYLLARSELRARGTGVAQAIAILEPLVARDPNYAPASALLAFAYYLLPTYSGDARSLPIEEARRSLQASREKAEAAARRAIASDPTHATAQGALAAIEHSRGRWAVAEQLYQKALMLDPGDPETLTIYSNMLAGTGRLKDALAVKERLRIAEPFVPVYNINRAPVMILNRQIPETIQLLESIPANAAGGFARNVYLAWAYSVAGRRAEAADTLLLITSNQVTRQTVEDAARVLRTAPARTATPSSMPRIDNEMAFVYAQIGMLERTLDFPERTIELNYVMPISMFILWAPEVAPLRKTERFKAFVRKAGIVDYWRERGWPDLCRPVGADDFECD
jgi:TolB-like protein